MSQQRTADRRRLIRHIRANVLDQVFSSASNFGVAILAAHKLPLREFGAFSLLYGAYLLSLVICRGLVGEPYMMRFSSTPDGQVRQREQGQTQGALAIGAVCGGLLIAIGTTIGGDMQVAALILGLALPFLLLQDVCRWVSFTEARGGVASLSDGSWCILLGLLSVPVFLYSGQTSLAAVIFVWCISGVLSIVPIALIQRPSFKKAWFSQNWRLGLPMATSLVLERGSTLIANLMVATALSLSAVGILQAGQLIFSPLNVVFLGAISATAPEAIRLRRVDVVRARRFAHWVGALLSALPLVAIGMFSVLPRSIGRMAFGPAWSEGWQVLWPTCVLFVATGYSFGAKVFARATRNTRAVMLMGVVNAILTVAMVGASIVSGSTIVVAWASAACMLLTALLWWKAQSPRGDSFERQVDKESSFIGVLPG